MTALLGALLGFFSSMLPELFTFLKDRNDRNHELEILSFQLKQQKQRHSERLEIINAQAHHSSRQALYKTFYSKIKWVDALNGTVRPVLAYAFFALYVWTKMITVLAIDESLGVYYVTLYHTLWTQEDAAIFAGIISFYFGQRALSKQRRG